MPIALGLQSTSFGIFFIMKTAAGVFLVLPTVFFVMLFVYGPLQDGTDLFFGTLCLLSAVACFGLAWPLRRASRKLAWTCAAVGSFYFVLLILVPLLVTLIHPPKTRDATRAERAVPERGC
jgi:hypothetical protein